jgi:hypothetical protein
VPADYETRRFAQRQVAGIDDKGGEEQVSIWIEYQAEALWAVGRIVNVHLRPSAAPRADDYIFRGYELDDAITAANEALEDDSRVSSDEDVASDPAPFTREEILKPLERWFFHHGDSHRPD